MTHQVTEEGGLEGGSTAFANGMGIGIRDGSSKTRKTSVKICSSLPGQIHARKPRYGELVILSLRLCRIRVLRIRESGFLANFDSWRPKTPGLLAKRPSKRPKKDPKNRFTGPDFVNTESNRGSRDLFLRMRYSSTYRLNKDDRAGWRAGGWRLAAAEIFPSPSPLAAAAAAAARRMSQPGGGGGGANVRRRVHSRPLNSTQLSKPDSHYLT